MRFAAPLVCALLSTLAACDRCSAGPPAQLDAAASAAPALQGTASANGPVDRVRAERIALVYARLQWPVYVPNLATAFNTGAGEYRVVVGFDKRPDAATVVIRMSDGEVTDASIAAGDY
jgi:hypothetical protein